MSDTDDTPQRDPLSDLEAYRARKEAERLAAEEAEAERQRRRDDELARQQREAEAAERRAAEEAEAERIKAGEELDHEREDLVGQIYEADEAMRKDGALDTETARAAALIFSGARQLLQVRTQALLSGTDVEDAHQASSDNPMDLSNAELIISGLRADLDGAVAKAERLQRQLDESHARIDTLTEENDGLKTAVGEKESIINSQVHTIGILKDVNAQVGPLRKENNRYRRAFGDLPDEVDTSRLDGGSPAEPDTAASGEPKPDEPQDVGLDIVSDAAPSNDETPKRHKPSRLVMVDKAEADKVFDKIIASIDKQRTKRSSMLISGQSQVSNDIVFGRNTLIKSVEKQYGNQPAGKDLVEFIHTIFDELKLLADQQWTTMGSKSVNGTELLRKKVIAAKQHPDLVGPDSTT